LLRKAAATSFPHEAAACPGEGRGPARQVRPLGAMNGSSRPRSRPTTGRGA
jgi:hypothetical protein